MRRLISVAFLITGLCLQAQDASLVPGLVKDLRVATNDTLRADALARICFNLIRANPDSARAVGEQALTLAQRISNPRALGDANNNLGWLAAEQGDLDRADSLLAIALGIFQRLGRPQYTSVTLSNLGWLAEKRGDSVGSLARFQEALAMSEQASDSATIAILLYSIGITYRAVHEHDRSVEFIERSLAMERAMGRRNKMANCYVGLANTLRERGDTALAIAAFDSASVIYGALGDHVGGGLVHENLGDLEAERDPQRALQLYGLALAHYDTVQSPIDRAYLLVRLGTLELHMGQVGSARKHMLEGTVLAEGSGDRHLVMDYELALAELASMEGDAQSSFTHMQRHIALKDSLQGAGTQRELARLRTAFDTERKEKDNAILRAENSEQQERIRRNEIQLYGSVALGILALIAAALFFRNYRQKRKHAEVLEGLNTQLANSNSEITEINGLLEMKLLRSQMNPHFIYNCLNSATRMTQAGQQVEALAYLQGFARLLRMVLDHSVDDRVEIEAEAAFLRQYLKLEAVRLDGLHYEVEVDPALLKADADIPALLVQPFVENAVWHGLTERTGERRLTVRFTSDGEGIRCVIEDNGVGRDAATVAQGEASHRSLGMQLTSERLRLLSRRMSDDGQIHIEDLRDAQGKPTGTRVTLLLR